MRWATRARQEIRGRRSARPYVSQHAAASRALPTNPLPRPRRSIDAGAGGSHPRSTRPARALGATAGAVRFSPGDALLLALVVLSVALFIAYPLGCIVLKSFEGPDGALTLSLYAGVFDDYGHLIANSVFVGVLAAVLSTAASVLIAAVVRFGPRWASRALMGMLLVSLISPPFIASLAFIELFGRRGIITFSLLGISGNPYGWHGVVAMQVLFFTALNVILLTSVLDKVDPDVLRAARDLGTPMRAVFGSVVLPMLRPSILVCLLLTFVRSLADYGTPVVIGGRFETISTEIYMQIIGYSDIPASAVLNVVLLGVSVIVFVCYARLTLRSERLVATSARIGSSGDEASRLRLRGPFGAAAYLVAVAFFVLMALQYLTIFYTAFTKGLGLNASFTLDNLYHLLDFNLSSMVRSITYALIVAVVGSVLGALIAYYHRWRHVRGGSVLDFIVTMPYMLPGTCFGLGYILAFNHAPLKLTGTAAIIVLNMVFKQLSITTKAFGSSFARISPELGMAARDLGASRLGVLRDVLVPNVRSAFAVSFVNNFSTAMITIGAVLFLVSPSHKIAVFELFDALSTGKYGEAAMISCCIIVVSVLVNVLFSTLILRRRR